MLGQRAPRVLVLDGLNDVPAFAVAPAAHLLAALAPQYPVGSVFLAIVDPGVGGARRAIVVEAEGRHFVGPDNGLMSVVWQRARRRRCHEVAWRPARLSASFHGRDLFAPVAAAIAVGRVPRGWLRKADAPAVRLPAEDCYQVVYIDHYGNAMTGVRASAVRRDAHLVVGRRRLPFARTFVEAKGPFWTENSLGLVEIAVPCDHAASRLGLRVGQRIRIAR